jgi:hypothetical protein
VGQNERFWLLGLPITVTVGAVVDSRSLKNFRIHKYQTLPWRMFQGSSQGLATEQSAVLRLFPRLKCIKGPLIHFHKVLARAEQGLKLLIEFHIGIQLKPVSPSKNVRRPAAALVVKSFMGLNLTLIRALPSTCQLQVSSVRRHIPLSTS